MKSKEIKNIAIGVLIVSGLVVLYRKFLKIKNVIYRLPGSKSWSKRRLEEISDITIHHSATKTGSYLNYANYHVNSKGWPGIGYHYVIEQNGEIFQTSKLAWITYHNGFNNKNAVGVCLTGNFEINNPTKKQVESLLFLIRHLKQRLPKVKNLVGHKEYIRGHTSCPGKNFDINYFRRATNLNAYSFNLGPIASNNSLESGSFTVDASKFIYDKSKADN